MIIHGYGQFAASTQAAALENHAAISGSHTLAKTMDPQAAVDMGLIRSFGRHSRSLSLGKYSIVSPRWRSKASLPTLCFAHAGAIDVSVYP
jgi:hypothetical protein